MFPLCLCLRELIHSLLKSSRRQTAALVPKKPPISVSRPITRLKAKQPPRGEIESVVHEEIRYTAKGLNEFANSFKKNLANMCENGF